METRASYLLVGAFVLVLVAGLTGFVVWLVGARADRDVALYDIAFTGSVTGLQTGGQVRYLGVPVGRVEWIGIDPGNLGRVLVTAQIDQPQLIREDTVASLEMLGITGIAYVQLSEGSDEAPPLWPQPGRERPLIPSVPSTLEQVFDSTPELLAQGVELLGRLTEALDEANLRAFGDTLQNVEAVTGTLAGRTAELDRLVVDTAEAVAGVKTVAAEVGL
ncbi:MAG TPA: MlaD family protein, partial [Geminicoccaceae bacterium]|nr:MlaD family protein [Geminicoccaceae bacterium]